MTPDSWYEVVAADARLSQGDVILDCPILGWKSLGTAVGLGAPVDLAGLAQVGLRDVVVMTQACDLEHNKVSNAVLCPAVPLSVFRRGWEEDAKRRNQTPTERAWRRICDDIAAGLVWNQSFLSAHSDTATGTEVRVVFFTEVYTLPRAVLESVLAARGQPRLRLRPPYREHLSQAFARFFMRVGLPQPITLPS